MKINLKTFFSASTSFSIFDCKQITINTQYNRHLKQHKINFRCNSLIVIRRLIFVIFIFKFIFSREPTTNTSSNNNSNMKLMVVKKRCQEYEASFCFTASNMMNCNKYTKSYTNTHIQLYIILHSVDEMLIGCRVMTFYVKI